MSKKFLSFAITLVLGVTILYLNVEPGNAPDMKDTLEVSGVLQSFAIPKENELMMVNLKNDEHVYILRHFNTFIPDTTQASEWNIRYIDDWRLFDPNGRVRYVGGITSGKDTLYWTIRP